MNRTFPLSILALVALVTGACSTGSADRDRVLLVTTTTVEGSGLLDALAGAYNASQDRYRLLTTALGSGAALEMGRRGDADVLITHDPAGEARFIAEGHGTEQARLMVNEYILAGPPSDPAGVEGLTDLVVAMERLAGAGALFVSRGDDSGTHRKELELWNRTGEPAHRTRGSWYMEAGSGMAEALRLADQRSAYILTDSGTLRHLAEGLELELLARGVPPEVNAYQYTLPSRPMNEEGARNFLAWLRGPGQAVIAGHGTARFGEPLFRPATWTEPT